MMSSSYYWRLHREKKKEAETYRRNWKELETIKKDLDRDFDNNVSDCNKKIASCADELQDGIREVFSTFYRVQELTEAKEKEPSKDSAISSASSNLSGEISDLKNKQVQAEREAEHYAELARQAEREEWAAMFGKGRKMEK